MEKEDVSDIYHDLFVQEERNSTDQNREQLPTFFFNSNTKESN